MEVKELLGKDFKIEKNKNIVKELMKYGKSDEFKSILDYCKDKADELIEENRKIIKNRDRADIKGTYIDDKVRQIKVLDEVIEKVSNEYFEAYLEQRKTRYYSHIEFSSTKEELFSSEIDLNKIEIFEYRGIEHYLAYCIDLYSKGKEKDYYSGLNPYE